MATDACAVVQIPLTKGKVAIIDAADLTMLRDWQWSWRVDSCGYACSTKAIGNGKCVSVRLHRLLLKFPLAAIDHVNRDRLDNRRCNLRLCNDSQNQANRNALPHKSQFKGVTIRPSTGKFESQIWHKGNRHWLGTFRHEVDAARAYDAAALQLFGEFARLNFPLETTA